MFNWHLWPDVVNFSYLKKMSVKYNKKKYEKYEFYAFFHLLRNKSTVFHTQRKFWMKWKNHIIKQVSDNYSALPVALVYEHLWLIGLFFQDLKILKISSILRRCPSKNGFLKLAGCVFDWHLWPDLLSFTYWQKWG